MTITNRVSLKSVNAGNTPISDVPNAPTIGAVADAGDGTTATVAYTASTTGGAATTFTATSSPGGLTGTGSSPISVTGLVSGTAYTFTVTASNTTGSATSDSSSSITLAGVGKFESIATAGVASPNSYVEFTSIPQTYTHLQIRGIGRLTSGSQYVLMRFNSDSSSSNYKAHALEGDGSTAVSYVVAYGGISMAQAATVASTMNASVTDIFDYTNTNKYKTVRSIWGQDSNGSGNAVLGSGVWLNTAAIDTIRLHPNFSATFDSNTTFTLYGIKGS